MAWNMILYHLPEVLKADQVFVVEGEKDADTTWRSLGFVATCNPTLARANGQGIFLKPDPARKVVICKDDDEPGQKARATRCTIRRAPCQRSAPHSAISQFERRQRMVGERRQQKTTNRDCLLQHFHTWCQLSRISQLWS